MLQQKQFQHNLYNLYYRSKQRAGFRKIILLTGPLCYVTKTVTVLGHLFLNYTLCFLSVLQAWFYGCPCYFVSLMS